MTPTRTVRISSASLRQQFHPCEPAFIRDVCHAHCCESSSFPGGYLVPVIDSQIPLLEARGISVVESRIASIEGRRKCPAKTGAELCSLHGTPAKPFGCVVSPFTLTSRDTLVVLNRYRLLRCYRAKGSLPAYRAHVWSLDLLFGEEEATRIVEALDLGSGDLEAAMLESSYLAIREDQGIVSLALYGHAYGRARA